MILFKKPKRSLAICLLMILVMVSGCSSSKSREDRYKSYVESLITANYLNVSDEYILTTGANKDDAEGMYLQNVTRLSNNLSAYYDLEVASDPQLAPAMVELSKKIYSKARYTVDKAYKDNNIYYVDVTIYPIDLLNQTHNDVLNYIDNFNDRVQNGEYNNYVKEDYEHEFASGIYNILDDACTNITYADPVTLKIRIIQSDDNFYISNDDFRAIDMAILSTDAASYEDAEDASKETEDTDADTLEDTAAETAAENPDNTEAVTEGTDTEATEAEAQ